MEDIDLYKQRQYNIEEEKIIEIDKFFVLPDKVKEYFFVENKKLVDGGKIGYYDPDNPGFNYTLDPENKSERGILNQITEKIELQTERKVLKLSVVFSTSSKDNMHGCLHVDAFESQELDNKYSGIIYLSQNFPADSGTTLYHYQDIEQTLMSLNYSINDFLEISHIVNSMHISKDNFVKQKCSDEVKRIMSEFKQYKKFESVFNKMVAYPLYVLHSQDNFFGESDYPIDSRVTLSIYFELSENELPDFLKVSE